MTTGAVQLTANRLQRQSNPTLGNVSRFLVVMASVSLASKIVEWLTSSMLSAGLGVSLDPFSLSVARQATVTLFGIGAARWFSQDGQGLAEQRFMLFTPLAALGTGLVLAWLGQLVGGADALDWLIAPVYLLWAWGAAASLG